MDNGGDILRLCRLCLVKDDVNIPIFEEQGDIRQIFLKISSCLPVKVSREDKLPKKICDGCSYKLDMLYEFWNTTANAEKQLLSWLGEAGMNAKMADGTISAVAQQIKPVETFVKQEAIDPSDIHADDNDDDKSYMFQQKFAVEEAGPSATVTSNEEEPPPKRARRTAAVKAQIAMDPESDDDDDSGEPITKVEDESEESEGDDHEPPFVDVPSTSADDQPGPSGVGKDGVEAPPLYQDQLYSTNFSLDSLNANNLHMQCNYLMDIVDCQKQAVPNSILENSVVDELNETDAELLNLLTAEEDCTAILNNIATNEQFQRLISNEADFVQTEEMEQFMNKTCEAPLPSTEKEEKSTQEGFKCLQCGRICSTKKLLKKHLLIHTQERSFPCEICGKLFRHRYEVTAHRKGHNKPTFQCDICSRMFIHKSHLNVHRKKHLGEYTAFCKECQMGFVSLTSFKTHRNNYHDNLQLICDSCGAKLSSLSALKEHKLIHDPNYGKERSHVCDICGKSYLTSRNLRSHMKIHSKICPYKCSICGKSVSSKNILETHLKMHTGVKDFNCEICDKNFASKEYLKVHQRIHNGDKPFECTMCGKRFTQKTSLTVHIRYHTGQKPYKCECGKEFTTKSHLMTHYKTHDIGGVDIEYISHPLPANLNL